MRTTEEDWRRVKEVTGNNERRLKIAQELHDKHQAEGTLKLYRRIVEDFQEFCNTEEGLSYENFGEKEIANFVLEKCEEKRQDQTYQAAIKPAIRRIEEIRGISEERTGFTPLINRWLSGAKRRAAELKGPAKKMDMLPIEVVKIIIEREVWDKIGKIEDINAIALRTIYRWTVMFFTLCRFNEFKKLKGKHFSTAEGGEGIKIIFPCAKNDQLHKGQEKMIPKQMGETIDPMGLTLVYFRRMGLEMNEAEEGYINCRINSKGKAVKRRPLGETTAVESAKKLLRDYGAGNIRYGESSAKRTGTTLALKNGVSVDEVQQIGGWKTAGMPMRYWVSLDENKLDLVTKMNIV